MELTPAAGRAPGAGAALAAVASRRGYRWLFAVLAAAITFLYTLLLPFADTQQFSLANWQWLDGQALGLSLALGAGLAAVLTLQVYAVRQVAARRARGAAGGLLGFAASVAPSMLCCTPVVPTVLGGFGLSGAALFTTTGTLQYVFAAHETAFLAGSLALLAVTAWWSARRIARAACLAPGGSCPAPHSQAPRPGLPARSEET
jgi:hypothetical protein